MERAIYGTSSKKRWEWVVQGAGQSMVQWVRKWGHQEVNLDPYTGFDQIDLDPYTGFERLG